MALMWHLQFDKAVFAKRPRVIIVSTPNAEFNVNFNMEADQFRDTDHKFEWCVYLSKSFFGYTCPCDVC